MKENNNLNERLIEFVAMKKLSISKIMDIAKTDSYLSFITPSLISDYLSNIKKADSAFLYTIANYYNISYAWLLGINVPITHHIPELIPLKFKKVPLIK